MPKGTCADGRRAQAGQELEPQQSPPCLHAKAEGQPTPCRQGPRAQELRLPAAQEPAYERAEHEPRLGRERNVSGDADEDADHQAQRVYGRYPRPGEASRHAAAAALAPVVQSASTGHVQPGAAIASTVVSALRQRDVLPRTRLILALNARAVARPRSELAFDHPRRRLVRGELSTKL